MDEGSNYSTPDAVGDDTDDDEFDPAERDNTAGTITRRQIDQLGKGRACAGCRYRKMVRISLDNLNRVDKTDSL